MSVAVIVLVVEFFYVYAGMTVSRANDLMFGSMSYFELLKFNFGVILKMIAGPVMALLFLVFPKSSAWKIILGYLVVLAAIYVSFRISQTIPLATSMNFIIIISSTVLFYISTQLFLFSLASSIIDPGKVINKINKTKWRELF